jgi:hypothetical protein
MGKLLKAILKEQQKQTKILKSIENELKEASSTEVDINKLAAALSDYQTKSMKTTVDPHDHTEALENIIKINMEDFPFRTSKDF